MPALSSRPLAAQLTMPLDADAVGDRACARAQEGYIFRLEPVWNTSIQLVKPHPEGLWGQDPWLAMCQTTATEADRPHCDGEVNEALEDVQSACWHVYNWVPEKYHHLNWTAQECWVDRADRSMVYLDVQQPLYFYGDLFAVAACMVIALTFAICIARQHQESVISVMHSMRNPFDFGLAHDSEGHSASLGGSTSESSRMTLQAKAEILRTQLGISPAIPIAGVVAQAVQHFGLDGQANGMNVSDKADLCLSTLNSASRAGMSSVRRDSHPTIGHYSSAYCGRLSVARSSTSSFAGDNPPCESSVAPAPSEASLRDWPRHLRDVPRLSTNSQEMI